MKTKKYLFLFLFTLVLAGSILYIKDSFQSTLLKGQFARGTCTGDNLGQVNCALLSELQCNGYTTLNGVKQCTLASADATPVEVLLDGKNITFEYNRDLDQIRFDIPSVETPTISSIVIPLSGTTFPSAEALTPMTITGATLNQPVTVDTTLNTINLNVTLQNAGFIEMHIPTENFCITGQECNLPNTCGDGNVSEGEDEICDCLARNDERIQCAPLPIGARCNHSCQITCDDVTKRWDGRECQGSTTSCADLIPTTSCTELKDVPCAQYYNTTNNNTICANSSGGDGAGKSKGGLPESGSSSCIDSRTTCDTETECNLLPIKSTCENIPNDFEDATRCSDYYNPATGYVCTISEVISRKPGEISCKESTTQQCTAPETEELFTFQYLFDEKEIKATPESTGQEYIPDKSGNELHGDINETLDLVESIESKAGQFVNGTSLDIQIPEIIDDKTLTNIFPSNAITFEACIKPEENTRKQQLLHVTGREAVDIINVNIQPQEREGKVRQLLQDPSSQYNLALYSRGNEIFNISTGTVRPNDWQHVAFTYSAGHLTFYIDGEEVATPPIAVTPFIPRLDMWLEAQVGQNRDKGNQYLGLIDEMAVYSSVLSASTIEDHASSCKEAVQIIECKEIKTPLSCEKLTVADIERYENGCAAFYNPKTGKLCAPNPEEEKQAEDALRKELGQEAYDALSPAEKAAKLQEAIERRRRGDSKRGMLGDTPDRAGTINPCIESTTSCTATETSDTNYGGGGRGGSYDDRPGDRPRGGGGGTTPKTYSTMVQPELRPAAPTIPKMVRGYNDGTLKATNNLTVEDAYRLAVRAYAAIHPEIDLNKIETNPFAFLRGQNIVQGYNGEYEPKKEISPIEFSKIMIAIADGQKQEYHKPNWENLVFVRATQKNILPFNIIDQYNNIHTPIKRIHAIEILHKTLEYKLGTMEFANLFIDPKLFEEYKRYGTIVSKIPADTTLRTSAPTEIPTIPSYSNETVHIGAFNMLLNANNAVDLGKLSYKAYQIFIKGLIQINPQLFGTATPLTQTEYEKIVKNLLSGETPVWDTRTGLAPTNQRWEWDAINGRWKKVLAGTTDFNPTDTNPITQ